MNDHRFSGLTEELEQQFDEPVSVIPNDLEAMLAAMGDGGLGLPSLDKYLSGGGDFTVYNGNHRVKIARILDWDEIPAVIDLLTRGQAATKLVRRNHERGSFDSGLFTEFVDREFGDDPEIEELTRAMGMEEDEFFKLYQKEPDPNDPDDDPESDPGSDRDPTIDMVDALTEVVAQLMETYGETIEFDFMAFAWRGKSHLLVSMSPETKKLFGRLLKRLADDETNINEVLPEAIEYILRKEDGGD